MPIVELSELRAKVDTALLCLKINDSLLFDFEIDIPEVSISHRLGLYLQVLFNGFDVDCEYNRHLGSVKKANNKIVRPDIVIHKRKKDTHNSLVIEVKTKYNAKEIKKDLDKLIALTTKEVAIENEDQLHGYDFGLFLLFKRKDTVPTQVWFENGRPTLRYKIGLYPKFEGLLNIE